MYLISLSLGLLLGPSLVQIQRFREGQKFKLTIQNIKGSIWQQPFWFALKKKAQFVLILQNSLVNDYEEESFFFFLVFLSFQFYDVGRALAIQNNQKQSINAKKLPPKQKNCVSMQNVVNFILKKCFSLKI